jgi:N-acetylmuramoyl-L-alanine amidase
MSRLFALLALGFSGISPLVSAAEPAVALDVGHSLQASGARGASGMTEFSHNLQLARAVEPQLQALGVRSQLIGAQGEITILSQRTMQARGDALFISLHHDSVQTRYLAQARHFHGYALFVSRKNPAPAASLACARQIARMLQANGETPTAHHAEPIAGENRPWADQALGIYWFDDLIVLKSASQPAVLIENGVIVNPDEEAHLAQPDVLRAHAAALARGIAQCLAPAR